MKNTGILYIRMFVTLLVSLYTSRVTLELLGVDDFGVYGVIGGVVTLFSFLTRTLTASFNRYLCIGIAHDDENEINHVVGASMIIQALIVLTVLILGETIGIWFINNYLVIRPEKLVAAHIVFQFSVATFILNILTSAYNSIIISYERMSVYAYICIFEVIAKLAVVFALGLSVTGRLECYAGYLFGVQALILAVYYAYTKRAYPRIHADFKDSRPYVRSMISFAGFGFLGSFAFVAKNQGLNFLLNIFCGPALNAARSVSFQVYTAVYNFVGNFQTAFSPYILKRQTTDSESACNDDIKVFTVLSFGVMVFLMIPIWFVAPEIIHLWLGDNVPPYTVVFTRLILIIGLCEAVSAPLLNIINGSGRIKTLQIMAFIIYTFVVLCSYQFLKNGGSPSIVYYVDVIANVVMIGIRIIVAGNTTDLHPAEYMKVTFMPMIFVLSGIGLIYFCTEKNMVNSIAGILVSELLLMVYIYKYTPREIMRTIFKRLLRN